MVTRKRNRKKCHRYRYKAVLVRIDRQNVETMSPGILVAAAEWKIVV
ncbi:MAG TPA: hypothetical protein VN549_00690 [Negativicutes bacterium]|nr:hypothetical protein [Negativicutes bacterium]